MRFSVSLPLLRDLSSADPFRETFELARLAEEAGFDTATIGHHHFMPGNMADPLTFLAAVAARLGDAWLCGPVQSLAKAQSCLDRYRASGGDAWILRRYAWVAPTRAEVEDDVLPAYVDGLLEHWRESVEDDAERELFARL